MSAVLETRYPRPGRFLGILQGCEQTEIDEIITRTNYQDASAPSPMQISAVCTLGLRFMTR